MDLDDDGAIGFGLTDDINQAAQEPEGRLWVAVINQAIMDAGQIGPRLTAQKVNYDDVRSAMHFLSSDSLDQVCDGIGIDALALREVLASRYDWAKQLFSKDGFTRMVRSNFTLDDSKNREMM